MLPKRTRSRWSAPLLAIAGLLIAAVVAAPVTARGGPPGNNGTIKIDRLEFDNHPNNEPHVGCIFEVDFYGFDEGDLWADVVFEAHPPTSRGMLLTDRVFIGQDDNSGGGSEAGWDASADYDLSAALASYPVHANQGHHVKLTIHADGSQGADTKHKVFWVEGCSPPTTPPTTPPGGIAPGGGGSKPPAGSGTAGGNPPVGMLPDTAVSSDNRAAKLLAALALIGISATVPAVRVRQRAGRE